jgi:hypothetical protein
MFCDALQEGEIYEAYLLYASLHGLETDEQEMRARISRYLANQPDTLIDDAILAVAEDFIVAPPDVVLQRWGKSRIYELIESPVGQWRHQVSETWFENGCRFTNDARDPAVFHFWTMFEADPQLVSNERAQRVLPLPLGARVSFELQTDLVKVTHRQAGDMGHLPPQLTDELLQRNQLNIRYLPLVDRAENIRGSAHYTLLVTAAVPEISLECIVGYAAKAMGAIRSKC